MRVSHPAADVGEKFPETPLEGLGGELVAGGPVVHKGEEGIHGGNGGGEVGNGLQQEGVELILFKIIVRKTAKECFPARRTLQLLGHTPKDRSADTDHRGGIHRGHEGTLEGLVVPVGVAEKSLADLPDGIHAHTGMMLE